MTEEVQEVPKWMKELEAKRENRLKTRLGHEAGAGSPCLTCGEKCPGLDLHFWRKICKNCRCGKESHDVNDDDIYGWAQFQLLGSKPIKSRKIVLPGKKEEVELEWAPKGQSDVVESYLKDLHPDLLPIKGSPAAQERKQLLQKQIPLHDVDPLLCHALTDHEIEQMNNYIAHVKENSVGVGHIIKLNQINRGNLHNMAVTNSQIVANRVVAQIPNSEGVVLQGSDRALLFKSSKNLQKNVQELKLDDISSLEHVAMRPGAIRDVNYPIYGVNRGEICANEPRVDDPGINYQDNCENTSQNRSHTRDNQLPKNFGGNPIDYQSSASTGVLRDVIYPVGTSEVGRNLLRAGDNQFPQTLVGNSTEYQSPSITSMRDINYPRNAANNALNRQIQSEFVGNTEEQGAPSRAGILRDLNYPIISPGNLGNSGDFTNQAPKDLVGNAVNYQNRTSIGNLTDSKYPTAHNIKYNPHYDNRNARNLNKLPNYAQNSLDNVEDIQNPLDNNQQRPLYGDANVNFIPPGANYGELRDNAHNLDALGGFGGKMLPHYAPGSYKTFSNPQNPQQIGNIRDLAYSTYDPTIHGNCNDFEQNLGDYRGKNPKNVSFDPALAEKTNFYAQKSYNCDANSLNVQEQEQNPMYINIGGITDVEYPVNEIKTALEKENDIFETNYPRKIQHDPHAFDKLPECHRCKNVFEQNSIVIGIERSDALWHSDCFRCAGCNQNLADFVYFYNKESDNVYCGRDYAKIRGIPRCQACDELIFVKEYCLAENSTFHVKHFCCFECDEPLAGQNYVMEDAQPLCLPCFEKLKAERCKACLQVIKPDEQGANLSGVHFHANDDCFCCKVCNKPLLGAKLLFKNQNLYCSSECFRADKL